MTCNEIINEVENGVKFTINFQNRTCRVNGEVVVSEEIAARDWKQHGSLPLSVALHRIEKAYRNYKHSVPSERSESHRRSYFKALSATELSDEDMMYGEQREVARCKLEIRLLTYIIQVYITLQKECCSLFYQSPNDKDLIILRSWVEPS